MADQIMTVSKQRLIKKAGSVKPEEMRQIERALQVQLGLE
jgi:mRNA-degrading endonuclease toxin of MazEF toxin-antitoxin module